MLGLPTDRQPTARCPEFVPLLVLSELLLLLMELLLLLVMVPAAAACRRYQAGEDAARLRQLACTWVGGAGGAKPPSGGGVRRALHKLPTHCPAAGSPPGAPCSTSLPADSTSSWSQSMMVSGQGGRAGEG